MTDLVIHWFRRDLRLSDNPALCAAARRGRVLPVYVYEDGAAGCHAPGAASRWWLHHSLVALNQSLGGTLCLLRGDPAQCLSELIRKTAAIAVTWTRRYEPDAIAHDSAIKRYLARLGVEVISKNGTLLWEPWDVLKSDQTPYRVFTPFYKRASFSAPQPRHPLPAPEAEFVGKSDLTIDALALLPAVNWYQGLAEAWKPGEEGATERLSRFLDAGLRQYRHGRDRPAQLVTSRLSPHLHFGEISPNTAWYASQVRGAELAEEDNSERFRSELGWREFAHSLLFHYPNMPDTNLRNRFDAFPWTVSGEALRRWQAGRTGIPLVDAGMRELWHTGYMHNRVRMIVASFLVKNLGVHWREGARWFWDTLVDADLANNSAGWQWVAGCGMDAAPYFRVFNPVTQGQKFDPDGAYVRKWVPELANCPLQYVFCPWTAPSKVLAEADVVLGATYPAPIVDLKASREAALAAFKALP